MSTTKTSRQNRRRDWRLRNKANLKLYRTNFPDDGSRDHCPTTPNITKVWGTFSRNPAVNPALRSEADLVASFYTFPMLAPGGGPWWVCLDPPSGHTLGASKSSMLAGARQDPANERSATKSSD